MQTDKEIVELERKREEEASLEERRNERIKNMKVDIVKKLPESCDHSVLIAFKFRDGRKIESKFSINATIQEMYQFVFTNMEMNLPFSLYTSFPQHKIESSNHTTANPLCDYPLRGSTVMVQESSSTDNYDFFLDVGTMHDAAVSEESGSGILDPPIEYFQLL